jgi:hypothetical protein
MLDGVMERINKISQPQLGSTISNFRFELALNLFPSAKNTRKENFV